MAFASSSAFVATPGSRSHAAAPASRAAAGFRGASPAGAPDAIGGFAPPRFISSLCAAGTAAAAALARGQGQRRRGPRGRAAWDDAGAAARSRVRCRGLKTGLVGLPNVGKSTLFNALCDSATAEAANFPFCTIDPNVGAATVPDERLGKLAEAAKSEKVIPEAIEMVDIAGLVKGAANGEGLGNKFLSNIRMVDVIIHVVRCFEDEDITHVDGSVDPLRDIETINLELILSDLERCERRIEKLEKEVKRMGSKATTEKIELEALLKIKEALESQSSVRTVLEDLPPGPVTDSVKELGFLTSKRVIYAANVKEDDLAEGNEFFERVREHAKEQGDGCVLVSAQVEAELKGLDEAEATEFLEALGVEESGCGKLVRAAYSLLGLRTYFTVGPKETRAWTIRAGWLAPKAASVIHSDFEKGFIRAQTMTWQDMLDCGGDEDVARKKGILRAEGKEYEVQEGDVLHFLFN